MKKVHFVKSFLAMTAALCLLVACDPIPDLGDTVYQDPAINQSILTAYNKMGKVSRVYKSRAELSDARFFTGQVIKNLYGHEEVEFYGALVEYDSVDEGILSYVENLPNANALMHQGYVGVNYQEDKRYVEFSTYFDYGTKEIIAHEVRIFSGDFRNIYEKDIWYAKSVLFDPSLEIDLNREINIKTGEHYGNGIYKGDAQGFYKITTEYPEELESLGELTAVYGVYDYDGSLLKRKMNNSQYYLYYYAEYESLKEPVALYYENRKDEKNGSFPKNAVYMDSEHYYVSYQEIRENSTDKRSRGYASIFNGAEYDGFTGGVKLPAIRYKEGNLSLYEYIEKEAAATYGEVDDYPSVIEKFGDLSKVYAYTFEDGKLSNEGGNSEERYIYIAEFNDFNPEITEKYSSMEDGYYPECHYGRYDWSNKKYIEYSEYKRNGSVSYVVANFYSIDIDIVRGVSLSDFDMYEDFYDFIIGKAKYTFKTLDAAEYPIVNEFAKFGTNPQVYAYVHETDGLKKDWWNDDDGYNVWYYVSYTDFNAPVKTYMNEKEEEWCESIPGFDSTKKYIVFRQQWQKDADKECWYGLYLTDNTLYSPNNRKCVSYYWNVAEGKNLYDEFVDEALTSFKELTDESEYSIIAEAKKFGTNARVYAYVHETKGIKKEWWDNGYDVWYYVSYTDFNAPVKTYLNEKEEEWCVSIPGFDSANKYIVFCQQWQKDPDKECCYDVYLTDNTMYSPDNRKCVRYYWNVVEGKYLYDEFVDEALTSFKELTDESEYSIIAEAKKFGTNARVYAYVHETKGIKKEWWDNGYDVYYYVEYDDLCDSAKKYISNHESKGCDGLLNHEGDYSYNIPNYDKNKKYIVFNEMDRINDQGEAKKYRYYLYITDDSLYNNGKSVVYRWNIFDESSIYDGFSNDAATTFELLNESDYPILDQFAEFGSGARVYAWIHESEGFKKNYPTGDDDFYTINYFVSYDSLNSTVDSAIKNLNLQWCQKIPDFDKMKKYIIFSECYSKNAQGIFYVSHYSLYITNSNMYGDENRKAVYYWLNIQEGKTLYEAFEAALSQN